MGERTNEQQKKIDAVLASADWTAGEKAVIKFQFNMWGHFYTSLFETLQHADFINMEKLRKGFPDEVEGFLAWREGDLGQRIDETIGL